MIREQATTGEMVGELGKGVNPKCGAWGDRGKPSPGLAYGSPTLSLGRCALRDTWGEGSDSSLPSPA